MRIALTLVLASLLFAPSALAAPSGAPVRLWSVSRVDQGGGEAAVQHGGQVGGTLRQVVDLGRVAFNFRGTPLFDRAEGDVFSSADGTHYSVGATAPLLNPLQPGTPKGGLAHLDEYQAYVKRASDASLKITVSGALAEAIDANARVDESQCPPAVVRCRPIRTIVRFDARAYAASAGGDFFHVGGVAFVKGRHALWDHWVATSADSQTPVWSSENFLFDPDYDDSDTFSHPRMTLDRPATVKVPLASVRPGELFAVHVRLEAEAVNDRGAESAAQAHIRDPQAADPALLTTRGLARRGRPAFKEPAAAAPGQARCPHGTPRHAGTLQLSAPDYPASESDGDPLVLVTRTGGSRGAASVTVGTRPGTATAGADFASTRTTVRFAAGDDTPRLVAVPLREDGRIEPAETFSVTVGHARCAGLGARRTATVTILDDDAPPPAEPAPAPAPTATATPEPTPAPAPAGLDHTFGAGGRVSIPVGDADGAAVAIQPGDGILTAGSRGTPTGRDFVVTRHDASGSPDTGFGSGGVAATDFGGDDDVAHAVAALPDGGAVAAGVTDAGGFTKLQFALARYRADGTLDRGFGAGGTVRTTVLDAGQANALLVQPDGKLLAGGFAAHGVLADSDFALVRYNADGSLDTTFGGGDGIVTTDLGTRSDDIRALALQPDGKIVAAGGSEERVALARYEPDGTPDPSFAAGATTMSFGDGAHGVALTSSGQIMISGWAFAAATRVDFALARFTDRGALDTTFGAHGVATADFAGADDYGERVAVDSQGRSIVAGTAGDDLGLVRFGPGGGLDTTFADGGRLAVDFHGKRDQGKDVALDAAGRIVAAGTTVAPGGIELALARANP
jgi:uncharacterized delta-60 repeat protein